MPRAEKSIVVQVPAEFLFDVIADYTRYPEFSSDVVASRILRDEGDIKEVEFTIKVIKKISYTLRMIHRRPETIEWSLVRGDLMKSNQGRWRFVALDSQRTEAHYEIELGLKAFMPKAISTKLIGVNLPSMLNEYRERAEKLFRTA